jgi:hypothetical protein
MECLVSYLFCIQSLLWAGKSTPSKTFCRTGGGRTREGSSEHIDERWDEPPPRALLATSLSRPCGAPPPCRRRMPPVVLLRSSYSAPSPWPRTRTLLGPCLAGRMSHLLFSTSEHWQACQCAPPCARLWELHRVRARSRRGSLAVPRPCGAVTSAAARGPPRLQRRQCHPLRL